MGAEVRVYAGIPPVAVFASSTGTPLVLDSTTGKLYYLATPGDVVTPVTVGASGGTGGFVVNGRLTTESGVPVSQTDRLAQTHIFWTPYHDNVLSLWDSVALAWTPTKFTEIDFPVGTVIKNAGYDMFAFLNAGAVNLESLLWKNSVVTVTIAVPGVVHWVAHGHAVGDSIVFTTTGALPTNLVVGTLYYVFSVTDADNFTVATYPGNPVITTSGSQSGVHTAYSSRIRGTAVTYQDGRLCKSGDKTRLLLGSFMPDSTTTVEDSKGGVTSQLGGKRRLFNLYNQCDRSLIVVDTTDNWAAVAGLRFANGNAGNQVEAFIGWAESDIWAEARATLGLSSSSVAGFVGVCVNDGSTFAGRTVGIYNSNASTMNLTGAGDYAGPAKTGHNTIAWFEKAATSIGTNLWIGDGGGVSTFSSGLNAMIKG